MQQHKLIIQGHRGCRALCPENSIEGVREAFLLGAFAVEVDVRQTADAAFAVVHDPVVGVPYYRSPKGEDAMRVAFTPSSLLRRITFGHITADGFSQQKLRMVSIPLLREFLTDPSLEGKKLNLELKNDAPNGGAELDADTYIRRFCAEMDTITPKAKIWRIKSFDHSLIDRLREVRPEWPLHYLAEEPDQIQAALQRRPEGISVRADLVDGALIEKCGLEAIHLSVWTVNDADQAKRLFEMGVRDMVSDDPALLLDALKDEVS